MLRQRYWLSMTAYVTKSGTLLLSIVTSKPDGKAADATITITVFLTYPGSMLSLVSGTVIPQQ